MAKYWRVVANWAKKHEMPLRIADQLGRGRGRMRVLDRLKRPPIAPLIPRLTGWESRSLSAVWLGHATVLLRIDGVTILTDPVMSDRVGIGVGIATVGPMRLTRAPLRARQLPKVDLILLSHAHFDHLDRPTLQRMRKHAAVVTAKHTADLVRDLGFRHVHEVGWGESVKLLGLKITGREVKHWGARTFRDQHRGFNAYLIESPLHRILYGGDTAYQTHFRDVGQVDLAILGIGAYDPHIAAHATPEQAWEMAQHMPAQQVLPIHHSTFRLSHEPMDEPLRRLIAIAGNQANRIIGRRVGEEWTERT